MKAAFKELDLSSLAQFKATDLLEAPLTPSERGKPLQVPIQQIDFDALQPRRTIDEASIDELASSIQLHGVLEPVSLRTHPGIVGRYIVNRGERRVRAAQRAGLTEVAAFLDERHDPYAQAAENLHRENMSPFDLATFITEREREGHSRAEIARRLNKPRSFITEAARLIDAPDSIRQAFDAGRLGSDVRSLYRLASATKRQPVEAAALLAGDVAITRSSLDAALGQEVQVAEPGGPAVPPALIPQKERPPSAGRTVLVVEHAGRRGSLRWKAHDSAVAEVRFGDGSRDVVELKELRPVCWATEE